jgi:hypothetical protein
MENMTKDTPIDSTDAILVKLHFPAVLPTYARFNDLFKVYIEENHERITSILHSENFLNYFSPAGQNKGAYFDEDMEWMMGQLIGFDFMQNADKEKIIKKFMEIVKEMIKN